MIILERIKRTDKRILADMSIHYSQPKGFVGRNICYAVVYNGKYYGSIVGGSTPKYLNGRNIAFSFFNIQADFTTEIVNNIFFHVEKPYPIRNFNTKVLRQFRSRIMIDWFCEYNNIVKMFETLVELPRTGETYKRDKWFCFGQTKGFTCKRTGGKSSDSWSGKRVWDTENLRPKLTFFRKATHE